MQALGYQFLAASVCSENEHSCIGLGNLAYHLAYVFDCSRMSNHLLPEYLLFEYLGLAYESCLVGRIFYCNQYAVEVQRLLNKVERAQLDAFHSRFNVGVSGNHHDRGVNTHFLYFCQKFGSVQVRHLYVAENHVIMLFCHHLQSDCAILGGIRQVILIFKNTLQSRAYSPFIVNYQYPHIYCSYGLRKSHRSY